MLGTRPAAAAVTLRAKAVPTTSTLQRRRRRRRRQPESAPWRDARTRRGGRATHCGFVALRCAPRCGCSPHGSAGHCHGGVLLPRLEPLRILRARSGALLLARAIGFQATAVERHTVGLQAFRSAPSPTSSTPTPLPTRPASTAKTHPGRCRGRLVALKGRPPLGRPLLRALATTGGCCPLLRQDRACKS